MSLIRAFDFRKEHGALGRFAVAREPRRAVRLVDQTVAAEPVGMLDAAGEAPATGNAIAALDGDRACRRTGPRGHHRARIAENLPRHLRREIGSRHRAARCLDDAPGGPAVGLGELLDRLHVGRGDRASNPSQTRGMSMRNSRASCSAVEHVWRERAGLGLARRAPRSAAQARALARCSRGGVGCRPDLGKGPFQHRLFVSSIRALWRIRPVGQWHIAASALSPMAIAPEALR